jgi:hypothetical protein
LSDSYPLWPEHSVCMVQNVEFSSNFKAESHSFSGSASQKLEVKEISINNSPQVDFIPLGIFSEFQNLVGIYFYASNIPKRVNSGFFTKDFDEAEYLSINSCKLESIDQNAFEHLVKLRWLRLYNNQIKTLHFLIFGNTPNLIYMDIRSNQINSTNPDLFKKLNNLKFIESTGNQCIDKNLGCETCSISQSDLDSGFSKCHFNCLQIDDCSTNLGNIEYLSQDKIYELISKGNTNILLKSIFYQLNNFKRNSEKIQANFSSELEHQKSLSQNFNGTVHNLSEEIARILGHFSNVQDDNFSMLNKTIDNLQEIVKIAENSCKSEAENSKKIFESQALVIEEVAKARQVEFENQLNTFSEQFNRSVGKFEEDSVKMVEGFERTFKENTTNALSSNLEKTEGKVEKIVENLSLKFSEIKALMEVERMQWKLKEAEHTIEKINFQLESEKFKNQKLTMELQMEKIRKEFAETLESREAALKKELDEKYGEMINQKMEAFKNELKNDFRP